MKTIFLTNDDGFESHGLLHLYQSLKKIARVVVVAPAHEKSACGHGLSVSKPMRLIEIEKDFYKLDDGSPTDCVYIGICELFTKRPDLLISGINIGANMGEDVTYSGTVAAAMEGAIHGIPSIAISQCIRDKYGEENKIAQRDFELAADFVAFLAGLIFNNTYTIGERKLLNVNIPPIAKSACKGIRITQLGYRIYTPSIQKNSNPRMQKYYWIGLNPLAWQERNSDIAMPINHCDEHAKEESGMTFPLVSDFQAIDEGYISITPLHLDSTSYTDINRLNRYMQGNTF
ncbi:5'/3'-nucleotidase SurE [Helicobacter aurati]|uniref:5'-nucleotidase SurE n=1 Tax=Helicobacter aurati TaxID=137778 RepID=A0A3D8J357_9HELI|nr:5'/3'-nucleotidase SurE [Helicobacter aurati]RDU71656.1 5'/3'-nucleotidase SurE [Helicobacter aurati]